METKFEVGTQWKTRDGNRAVVLTDKDGGNFLVWNEGTKETLWHATRDGKISKGINKYPQDLIEPWTEPKSGVVWVNIYDNGEGSAFACKKIAYEKQLKADKTEWCNDVIARVKVKWTEGQYDT